MESVSIERLIELESRKRAKLLLFCYLKSRTMKITLSKTINPSSSKIVLFKKIEEIKSVFPKDALKHLEAELKNKKSIIDLSKFDKKAFAIQVGKNGNNTNEGLRKTASDIIKGYKGKIQLVGEGVNSAAFLSMIEGLVLSNYAFDEYQKDKEDKIEEIQVVGSKLKEKNIQELLKVLAANYQARNWVNEPVNKLTTERYIQDIKKIEETGATVEIFRKSKIQSLNMGGILAVNQGSLEEPALAIVEWKPKNAKNKKPVVLVGKGILFDTGGINIKTGDFMTDMKADMGGSAAVLGATKAVAENKLPIHIITLVPITENRINGKEIVPGDVITMHNGKMVEVLNTDAEGRLVLGDALSFAKKLKPELVIDAATLTGSAFRTSSHHGGIVMGTDESSINAMKIAGEKTYERLIELPMWEEFEESLKSNVADINNLGAGPGQAVCAGFFLKNFIDYPWLHLDIAGPAFIPSNMTYRKKGGTGFGVRLLYQFLKDKFELN